ncbi:MAG: hypothetical protein ACXWQE_02285 [Bdellovibrionales bacterium]
MKIKTLPIIISCALIFELVLLGCGNSGGQGGGAPSSNKMGTYLVDGFSSLRQINYAIDGQLNLEVTKQVRLELFPQILGTPESEIQTPDPVCEHDVDQTCGRARFKPLRSGLYIFRYALIRNSYENVPEAYQLITSGETIAEVASGSLVVEIPLRLKDLRLMGSRNHLLVEISAAIEGKILKLADHKFTPAKGQQYSDLDDLASNLKPEIFETTLDASATPRLIFSPFDIAQLEPALRRQIDSYRPLLASDAEFQAVDKATLHAGKLADLAAFSQTLAKLETAKAKKISDNYAFTQNLVTWGPELSQMGNVDRAKLLDVAFTKTPGFTLYNSLCELWVRKMLPELASERLQAESPVAVDPLDFMENCTSSRYRGISEIGFFHRLGFRYQPFFIFQNVYMVDSAHFKDLKPPGRNFTVQVTDKFYVRSRQELNAEVSLRPLSWIPLIGPYLSLAGTMAIDKSLKEDTGNELRFQTNMQLNVEENTFAIDFLKYRRCLIVRMNPEKTNDPDVQAFSRSAKSDLQRDQLRRALIERGLLVCNPQEAQPITKLEKYYYISAPKNESYQQDPADIRNRDVILPLRGERDFQAFIQAGKSRLEIPDSTAPDYGGITASLEQVEESIAAITPAAGGIYLDGLFF